MKCIFCNKYIAWDYTLGGYYSGIGEFKCYQAPKSYFGLQRHQAGYIKTVTQQPSNILTKESP